MVLLASFPICVFAMADEGVPVQKAETEPAAPQAFAARLLNVTDVVLAHHVDPPTRQQMLLAGTKALFTAAKVPQPLHLSRQISELGTREQCSEFLARTLLHTFGDKPLSKETQNAALEEMLKILPGGAQLTTVKEAQVLEQLQGNRYVGIGIALGMGEEDKLPRVSSDLAGGPARMAGVKAGDLIEEIDGVPTTGQDLPKIIDRLRGAEGTVVTIVVRQPGAAEARKLTITRGVVPRKTVIGHKALSEEQWEFRAEPELPIACVRILAIGASTLHELRKIEQQLRNEGYRALILDLRDASPGTLPSAVALADGLLDAGPIGRVQTAEGTREFQADAECLFRKWPLAVLVNSNTSGTAEWLAAALQDNHRAIIVGEQTSGSNYTSTPYPLEDQESAVILATGLLERGNGRALQRRDRADRDSRPQISKLFRSAATAAPSLQRTVTDLPPALQANTDKVDRRNHEHSGVLPDYRAKYPRQLVKTPMAGPPRIDNPAPLIINRNIAVSLDDAGKVVPLWNPLSVAVQLLKAELERAQPRE
jgi:carboxyl-terminal processing protease